MDRGRWEADTGNVGQNAMKLPISAVSICMVQEFCEVLRTRVEY